MKCDVVVIGLGHAGCEAVLACSRMGFDTIGITVNLGNVAEMSCNPSIGGPGKAHIVREIDALGGQMGITADMSFIQLRMLNTSKGPAVQALRAQIDKPRYQSLMKSEDVYKRQIMYRVFLNTAFTEQLAAAGVNIGFLWISNFAVPDTLRILPILSGLTTYFTFSQSQAQADPSQKTMTYLMPLMFVFITWSLPSGAAFYWVVSNIIGIIQNFLVKKQVDARLKRIYLCHAAFVHEQQIEGIADARDDGHHNTNRGHGTFPRATEHKADNARQGDPHSQHFDLCDFCLVEEDASQQHKDGIGEV